LNWLFLFRFQPIVAGPTLKLRHEPSAQHAPAPRMLRGRRNFCCCLRYLRL